MLRRSFLALLACLPAIRHLWPKKPPLTPAEVAALVAQKRDEAFESLVEELDKVVDWGPEGREHWLKHSATFRFDGPRPDVLMQDLGNVINRGYRATP